jgi:hypothetical protein
VGTFSNHTRIFGLNNPADITPISTLPLLQGDIIAVSSNGEPGKLVVWMTGSDNLGANLPLGTQRFESSFRQNLLPDGWTVQVDSFFDPANGIFTTAIPLSSHLFHGSDPTFVLAARLTGNVRACWRTEVAGFFRYWVRVHTPYALPGRVDRSRFVFRQLGPAPLVQ